MLPRGAAILGAEAAEQEVERRWEERLDDELIGRLAGCRDRHRLVEGGAVDAARDGDGGHGGFLPEPPRRLD